MQAATSEINQELNSAAQQVNSDLQQVTSSTELADGVAPFSNGDTETPSETGTLLPENLAEPGQSLDELNPEAILWPDLAAETRSDAVSLPAVEPAEDPVDPYVACLGTFAMALGGTMLAPDALELAPAPVLPQTITPEMIASVPEQPTALEAEAASPTPEVEPETPAVETAHPWAPGLGLSGPAEVDMQARFQAQMAAMEKSFEELDAKIMAQAEAQVSEAASSDEIVEAAADPEMDETAEPGELVIEDMLQSSESGEEPPAAYEASVSATEVLPPPAEPAPESESGEKPADELSAEYGAADQSAQNSPEDQPAG
jgi:hypothetical protein